MKYCEGVRDGLLGLNRKEKESFIEQQTLEINGRVFLTDDVKTEKKNLLREVNYEIKSSGFANINELVSWAEEDETCRAIFGAYGNSNSKNIYYPKSEDIKKGIIAVLKENFSVFSPGLAFRKNFKPSKL